MGPRSADPILPSALEDPEMSSLKVMGWNVENLLLPSADDAAACERVQHKLSTWRR